MMLYFPWYFIMPTYFLILLLMLQEVSINDFAFLFSHECAFVFLVTMDVMNNAACKCY